MMLRLGGTHRGTVNCVVTLEHLDDLVEMLETGLVAPAINRVYPLQEAAETVAHMFTGHTHDKVIIAM